MYAWLNGRMGTYVRKTQNIPINIDRVLLSCVLLGLSTKWPILTKSFRIISLAFHYIGIKSHLNTPAFQLFVLQFVQTHIKENIKAPRRWPLWWESTGDRWIPLTKSQLPEKCFHFVTSSCSYAKNVFIWWRHHVEQSYVCPNWRRGPEIFGWIDHIIPLKLNWYHCHYKRKYNERTCTCYGFYIIPTQGLVYMYASICVLFQETQQYICCTAAFKWQASLRTADISHPLKTSVMLSQPVIIRCKYR